MNYEETVIPNAFDAPVLHVRETDSTMNDARRLAETGAADGAVNDGTALFADFQRAGRGRIEGRTWEASAGENLLCTVILRRPALPGFTLRVGLAVALAFDSFLPPDRRTRIKWPNDVLFDGRKLAGILCENTGSVILVGTGLNIAQTVFPAELAKKAASLKTVLAGISLERADIPVRDRRALPEISEVLPVYLEKLKLVLETENWHEAVTDKLYRRGEKIRFIGGDPGKNAAVEGCLEGIGSAGELLLRPVGKDTAGPDGLLHLFSGEIPW